MFFVCVGMKDKTIDDKLIYIPNNDFKNKDDNIHKSEALKR